jgi:hypothetical protein
MLELGFGRWRRATVTMCGSPDSPHSSASPAGPTPMRARSPSPLPATPGLPKAPCISLDTMDFLVHISRKVWLRESWRVWRQAVIFLRPKPVVVVTATRPLASVWRGTSLHRALARRHLRWALTVWRNASQDSAPRALPACLCARGCVCSQPRPRAQRPEPGGARASSPGPLHPQQAPPRDTDHPYGTWTVQLETGSPRDAYHDRVPLSGQHERTGRLLGGWGNVRTGGVVPQAPTAHARTARASASSHHPGACTGTASKGITTRGGIYSKSTRSSNVAGKGVSVQVTFQPVSPPPLWRL